ncbi:MAG: hypothetical protein JJW01_02585 [Alphaproteobacteria bacterium]|nr:hypothetical protein [Rickettsiales bacterium]
MNTDKTIKEEALKFHSRQKKGKLSISLTKPLNTSEDLSLAYSPGVGFPCLEIKDNPALAYEYTSKGNFVAVISNGTAVLGFGDIGSLASKPVMEGKSALMKRFAGVDSVDVLVETKDVDEFVNVVANIGNTWGGINLEDIKAPECFAIEDRLKEKLKIPVFHDDQHGTATVVLAGLINACKLTNKNINTIKIVINGAGAAGIACADLLATFGLKKENITLCDTLGVIYKGRTERMNVYKERYATSNQLVKTLEDAAVGADVLIGLSAKGAFTQKILQKMADSPIVFALANPDPEILPQDAKDAKQGAIVATGRSDFPNQINNVMCFPFLFRAALDLRVRKITKEMQIATAKGIAELAAQEVSKEIKELYPNDKLEGDEYIVPKPYDKRLFRKVVISIAEIVINSNNHDCPFKSVEEYKKYLHKMHGDFM